MIALLLGIGCTNRPPVLLSINGVSYDYTMFEGGFSSPSLEIRDGDIMQLSLEVRDPDGDAVEVRFSDMPGIMTFEPFGTTGSLEVFEQALDTGSYAGFSALIVLLDDRDPPAWSETEVFFYYDRTEDSGQ